MGHTAALEQIAQMRAMLMAMREEENSLRSNLGIFKIEQPFSKDLQNLEKVPGRGDRQKWQGEKVPGWRRGDRQKWQGEDLHLKAWTRLG